ncbi:MAG: S41 family peptidase [Phycisphaerales bacterium]|nr:S41 family peptidase [Phycisphaerales bacterium]
MSKRSTLPLIGILGVAVVGSTIAVATNAIRITDDQYSFFDPIVDVSTLINALYVEEADIEAMQRGAIEGMLEELNDPYTTFVPTRDTKDFSKDLTGEYVGIGAEVQIRDGWLTISSPLDGSPAWKAGVMADDRVVEIDGESTEGLTIDESIDLLTGEPNTTVTVTVERGAETLKIDIVRDHIKVQAVKGFMREGGDGEWMHLIDPSAGIGYIRLTQFTPGCAQEVKDAIEHTKRELGGDLNGLVLDLRFNPGGLLDEAIEIADLFIEEGTIVSTKGRVFEEETDRATPEGTITDLPLLVMVNGQSASASEVLSGALSDHGRAVILGTRSFGKGSVQTVRPLESGAGVLKITEQYYYLPSGRLLHRRDDSTVWGVDPTSGYFVPVTTDETIDMLRARREQEIIEHNDDSEQVDLRDTQAVLEELSDPQLSAAIRVMQHRLATGEFEPVGIEANEPDDVALAELNTLRAQEERLLRELARLDKRMQAAEQEVPTEIIANDPRDFWDDETNLEGGELVVRDAEGNIVTTLRITGNSLEAWLVDADVEKKDSAPQSGDDDS